MQVRESFPRTQRSFRGAFTLLEVLIVVAIIVMLAGVGGYFLLQQYEEAKISKAKIDMKGLAEQAKIYSLNNGAAPTSIADLSAPQPNGAGPLVPADKTMNPWNQPYGLRDENGEIVIFTTPPNRPEITNHSK